MSRVAADVESVKGRCEDTLASLGVSRVLIDTQVILRVEQAIKRDRLLRDLLLPVVEQVQQIDAAIQSALEYIGDDWEEHNDRGWV